MSGKKFILGIDPGKAGGMAVLSDDLTVAEAWRMPEDWPSTALLMREIDAKYAPIGVAIEKVNAMPGQTKQGRVRMGATSAFSFGTAFGVVFGCSLMLVVPVHLVLPTAWKKASHGLAGGKGRSENKELSLKVARELYPEVDLKYKKDDGKADALHIARWLWKEKGK